MARSAVLAGVALLFVSASSLADEAPPPVETETVLPAPAHEKPVDKPKPKLEWKGPRVSGLELAGIGAFGVGLGALTLFTHDGDALWKGPILFDKAAISVGREETSDGRRRAGKASDYLLYAMTAWPLLDAGATAFRNPDVAWQLAAVDAGAYAINGFFTTLIKRTVRRERPWVAAQCYGPESQNDPNCRDSQSFLSGHTSQAFTSAGLICAEHAALPIYGGALDTAACVTGLMAASATGALRIAADAHYASDVFAGAALGLASGYVLPKLLHFGGSSVSKPSDVSKEKRRVAISALPVATPGGAMVLVNGIVF